MWHNNRRKVLILLEKKIVRPSKLLILHNNEIGTFCIDCTDTPVLRAAPVMRDASVSVIRAIGGSVAWGRATVDQDIETSL